MVTRFNSGTDYGNMTAEDFAQLLGLSAPAPSSAELVDSAVAPAYAPVNTYNTLYEGGSKPWWETATLAAPQTTSKPEGSSESKGSSNTPAPGWSGGDSSPGWMSNLGGAIYDVSQGFNLATGDPTNIAGNIAQGGFTGVPGNWDMNAALNAALAGGGKAAAGGLLGGIQAGGLNPGAMAMGGLVGGLGGLVGNLTGQLGQNMPGYLGLQSTPGQTIGLTNLGITPDVAKGLMGVANMATSFAPGPTGMLSKGALAALDLALNLGYGKNVAQQVTNLALSPLGMFGPLGQLAASVVGPSIASGLNYGYNAVFDPQKNWEFTNKEYQSMTPGAVNTLSTQQLAEWNKAVQDINFQAEVDAYNAMNANATQQAQAQQAYNEALAGWEDAWGLDTTGTPDAWSAAHAEANALGQDDETGGFSGLGGGFSDLAESQSTQDVAGNTSVSDTYDSYGGGWEGSGWNGQGAQASSNVGTGPAAAEYGWADQMGQGWGIDTSQQGTTVGSNEGTAGSDGSK